MKFSAILVWISLAAIAAAAPKFAVIRITDIYRDLPSTAALQKDIEAQREAIIQNKRGERLRAVLAEMQLLQGEMEAKKDDPESETVKKLIRDYEIKRQEAKTVWQEFEDFRAEEEKRINREMVEGMRSSLERISAAAQQIARERSFDGIFDSSGGSDTGVSFILYSGGSVDLTEDVIGLLDEKPLDAAVETPDAAGEAAQGEAPPAE